MTPEEQAYAAVDPVVEVRPEQRRRLSWFRILLLTAVVAAATTGLLTVPAAIRSTAAPTSSSMFMPYVDVTNTPWYPFDDATQPPSAWLALSFVVSGKTDACDPSWGGAYSLDEAARTMDLDRRIARLRQVGGHAAVSFGGAVNSELSVDCTDPKQLLDAYATVVHRYSFNTIDLDIEGAAASAPDVSVRRATAIYKLQQQEKLAGRSLQVWLTLPVSPTGLTSTGQSVLAATLAAKVDLAGVNAMTMDYGSALPPGQHLGTANASALTGLARQLTTAYRNAGVHIDADTVWQRIGATPMIGQNDVAAERFDLDDAQQLLLFAKQHSVRRLSMWSVNRDQACGPNYPDVTIVSPNCSGVSQAPGAFAKAFGTFTTAAVAVAPESSTPTSPSPATSKEPLMAADNPATSPYPIWNPVLPYASGTKIVWHHNVYEAKWWTQGATPDEPVASTTQTPWMLIGPVLPGEHPQPTPTLKAGTYPAWSATSTYLAGQRVLYDGLGYQAKWYAHGDVPGIVVGDPGQTPWEFITNP
ncbi:MAG: carbohydrate-binding protein [Nakamurella sp.]